MTSKPSRKRWPRQAAKGIRHNTTKNNQTPMEPAAIQLLRAQIHANDETIKEHTAEQTQIQQRIKLYQSRIDASPEVEQEYKQLTRDYQTALDFYNDLLKKRDQSAMATDLERRQEGEQFQVLDPANLPDKPVFSEKTQFRIGRTGCRPSARLRPNRLAGDAGYVFKKRKRCRGSAPCARPGDDSRT